MALQTACANGDPVLVLARDPSIIAVARDAARRMHRSISVLETSRQAASLLSGTGQGAARLLCDRETAQASPWLDLVAFAGEQGHPPALLVVSDTPVLGLPHGLSTVPPDSAIIAAALNLAPQRGAAASIGPGALRRGLDRGAVSVVYQPMIRLADRRPVMVEALARWSASYPPLPPDIFLPVVAREGLMRPLSMLVAAHAAREIGGLGRRLGMGVTLNLPLDLLHQHDLPGWLARARAGSALRASELAIELTENAVVHDRRALGRSLGRLRQAGYRVFLDDIRLDDPRESLFGLELGGIKLDRSVLPALQSSARTRLWLRRLAGRADRLGQVVVAEGIGDVGQMRMLAELGVHWAQGFMISRPLPASALRAWSEAWRAGRRG
jgi:EAL domain-containing protein (putative c-di-GMP-specific phosphodiesterase class I)